MPQEIEPAAAAAWLRSADPPRLIDCREPDEYAIARLEGSELLPLSQWPALDLSRLADSARSVLIYCHHGIRSMHAARLLEAQGHRDVRSLAGGIERWSVEIDPSVPRY